MALLLGSTLLAGIFTSINASVRNAASTRRDRYALIVRGLVAWAEYPYRIRRRTDDNPATLTALAERGHTLQEQLAESRAWVASESRAVSEVLDGCLMELSRAVGPACSDAWRLPPIAAGSEMNLEGFGPRGIAEIVMRLQCAISYRFGIRRLMWRRLVVRRLRRRSCLIGDNNVPELGQVVVQSLPLPRVEAVTEPIAKPGPLARQLLPGLGDEAEQTQILTCSDDFTTHLLRETLVTDGFDLRVGTSVDQIIAMVKNKPPSIMLVDFAVVDDGFELVRRLRSDVMTSCLPIIAIIEEAPTVTKITYLAAGVDDFLVKPYDPSELVARVRSRLHRTREYLEISPVTGLPGSTSILNEIRNRMRGKDCYAVCHVDIDRFKSVSDAYGFERGTRFIQALSRALLDASTAVGQPQTFLGHVGGDDFVLICLPEQVQPIIERAVTCFETAAEQLYDVDDVRRGHMVLTDRRGRVQRPNLATVSVGVALSTTRTYFEPKEVIAVASEMTRVAKKEPGSFVAYDRTRLLQRVTEPDSAR